MYISTVMINHYLFGRQFKKIINVIQENQFCTHYSYILLTLKYTKMRTKNPMAKKPHQILFCKNRYSPNVKVEHWEYAVLAEKKDNYVYRDQLSNHLSTYLRLGSYDQGVGPTETGHMLQEVFMREDPIYIYKPLVNFTSYPCTE